MEFEYITSIGEIWGLWTNKCLELFPLTILILELSTEMKSLKINLKASIKLKSRIRQEIFHIRPQEKDKREKKLSISSTPKKVIVTGATGFIGQHLVPLLLSHNFDVTAIARDVRKAKSFEWFDAVDFVSMDISEGVNNLNISSGMSLIHLAWSGLSNYDSAVHF